jgi:hypothetical protein
MRKPVLGMTAVAALALSTAANATVTIVQKDLGTAVYSGPAPNIDFQTTFPDSPNSASSPYIVGPGTSPTFYAQPFGTTDQYYATGPIPDGNGEPGTSPGVIDLTTFATTLGPINTLSFLWGSVDSYNTLEFLDAFDNVLGTFTGDDVNNPANGDQSNPATNRVVFFSLTDGAENSFRKLRLTSIGQNAFEIDNIAINPAVPEPATWALMILGFAGIGVALRRRSRPTLAQIA